MEVVSQKALQHNIVTITQGTADSVSNVSEMSSTSVAKRLLAIIPKTWFEQTALEDTGHTDISYGLLVSDVENAGLDLLIDHDESGLPISVNYEKVTTALVSYLKDLNDRLTRLEGVINNENNS